MRSPGPVPPGATAELRVSDRSGARRQYKLDKAIRIGRSADAEIALDDIEVSRLHASITRNEEGAYELEDLSSRNGTFVNGVQIERATLSFGDRIQIGQHTMLEFEPFDVAAEELRQRERFETVGRLGLGIAHDLNNLLAVLVAGMSYLDDLPASQTLGNADVKECIADMVLAAGRASDLSHSMLSYARGHRNQRSVIDVAALVEEVVRLLRRVMDGRVSIEVAVEPHVAVHGCWSELHQALMNLCLNARDAMPRGGTMRIGAAPVPGNGSTPEWTAACPAVVLSVSDTGSGMDAATRAKVFEPLFSTKDHSVSYGLGLATVREVVTRHGGSVAVESAPGRGSRFSMYLPLLSTDAARQGGTKEHVRSIAVRQVKPIRILLVDDEAIVRRSLARQLRGIGIEVAEAADGAQALEQFQKSRFDAVLLDIDVPGADGGPAHIALAQVDRSVRVILVTGRSDTHHAEQVRTSSVVEIVRKPYEIDALIVALTRAVQASTFELEEEGTRTRL